MHLETQGQERCSSLGADQEFTSYEGRGHQQPERRRPLHIWKGRGRLKDWDVYKSRVPPRPAVSDHQQPDDNARPVAGYTLTSTEHQQLSPTSNSYIREPNIQLGPIPPFYSFPRSSPPPRHSRRSSPELPGSEIGPLVG